MNSFAEYNARLCGEDLLDYFHFLLKERIEKPEDSSIKDIIAELQGIVIPKNLDGEIVIDLRERNKIAEDLAHQGKIEESLDLIKQILSVYPEHYGAYYTLGFISFSQGNYTEALDCFKQAFDYNPFFVDAVLRIFDCSVCLGDISEVEAILNKALTTQPNDPELTETKQHLQDNTYPERLSVHLRNTNPEKYAFKKELLKLKEMLENGNSNEALEKIKELI